MTRQAPLPAFPFPLLIDETRTAQTAAPGSVLINETISTTPPPPPSAAPSVVFVAT